MAIYYTYNFLSRGIFWSASYLMSLNGLPLSSNVSRLFGKSSLVIVLILLPDKKLATGNKSKFNFTLPIYGNCALGFYSQLLQIVQCVQLNWNG